MSADHINGNDHYNGEKLNNADSNNLSRQITLNLNAEQYERLFFQPTAAKGDLAKRLGNPTLLGVLGFLIPFTNTMFCLLEFQGASSASLQAISGSWYFFGGIAMTVASIAEFVLGNTFPFTVFMVYGVHWVNIAYTSDPWHPLAAAYGTAGSGAEAYAAGQGHYNVVMAMVSFAFLLGSLRTNAPFVVVFFTLIFLFGFFAGGQFEIAHNPTPEGLEYAVKCFKIAGGFGFVTLLVSWYLVIILVCASTGVPCPLPIFDLSTKLFAHSAAQKEEHAGSVRAAAVTEA